MEGIPPTFSRKPKALYIDENEDAVLECRLVAVPEPDIVWMDENGQQLRTEENIVVTVDSDMHMYTTILRIKTIKKTQSGIYKIIAKNREGEASLDIIVKVRTDEKEAPQILEPLKSMTVREGDSIILKSQVVGNPKPTVKWYKNGDPKHELPVKEDGDDYTLTLIQPSKTDTAEYTIIATNSVGTAESRALITVEGMFSFLLDLYHFSDPCIYLFDFNHCINNRLEAVELYPPR